MKSFYKLFAISIVVFCFAACGNAQKGIKIVPDEAQRKIDVLYDGQLFTSYIYPVDLEKPVLYPINTAKGTVITRGYPLDPRPFENPDHPHHVGAWFNHGEVGPLNFWGNHSIGPPRSAERRARLGWIRHRNIVSAQNGRDQGELIVACDWVDHTEKPWLKEETKFIFSGKGDWRIIERITKLTAQQDTVVFGDTKEGSLAIRMDRVFHEPTGKPETLLDANGKPTDVRAVNTEANGRIRNSEGAETEANVWGKAAKWVSMSAEKEGEKITVAMLDHKNNPGHPAHSHARGYGLFSTNNFGSHEFDENNPVFNFTMYPGQSTTFRWMIIIKTNGFATDNELNKMFTDFSK